jgi:type III secretion protein L
VLDAVRKVINDFDDRERVSTVVRSCLDLVRSQKHVSVSVHPSQVEYIRGQVEELRRDFSAIVQIDIHPDSELGVDACIVESEIGVVKASLAGQVEILRERLSGAFAPKVDPDADDA